MDEVLVEVACKHSTLWRHNTPRTMKLISEKIAVINIAGGPNLLTTTMPAIKNPLTFIAYPIRKHFRLIFKYLILEVGPLIAPRKELPNLFRVQIKIKRLQFSSEFHCFLFISFAHFLVTLTFWEMSWRIFLKTMLPTHFHSCQVSTDK